ncbi:MAG: GDP-mannose 4,6-dehydratase [Victivallaceae bacterium]|jgi:GDP-4-dehydro-6-deoxy-D-mannose reductase
MKKFLITGISGFVGQHFIDFLEANRINTHVMGVDLAENKSGKKNTYVTQSFQRIDLLNRDEIEHVLLEFQPDYVLHLASYSSVAFSWQEPVLSFQNNMNVFLNLVETIRRQGLKPRILSVGSSEAYGNINQDHLPLVEESPLDPVSPYAVARVSQELLSKVYADSYGVDLVITRSFNHIGTGQKDIFVISAFAKQIAEIKKAGRKNGVLSTGDLHIVRDFLDVRDVVRAYYLLLTQGKSGQIYNVCSGKGHSLQEVVAELASIAGIEITTELNPAFVRPSDNRVIVGSNNKINKDLGWSPEISFQQSLKDILNYWEYLV